MEIEVEVWSCSIKLNFEIEEMVVEDIWSWWIGSWRNLEVMKLMKFKVEDSWN